MKMCVYLLVGLLWLAGCKEKTDDDKADPKPEPEVTIDPNYKSTAVVPVTNSTVHLDFNSVGKKNVHPRLLFSAADIASIKATVQTDAYAKATYDDVMSKANALLGSPLLAYGLDGAGLRIENIHHFANNQAPYLILAYQYTKDPRYAQRCWAQLDLMCTYPDWGANRHFLDTGMAAKTVGLAYDGLFDFLSEAQKTKLVNAVKVYALQPGKTQIETSSGPFKWYLSNDNWNGICHGGMIMAALAMYESDPGFMSQVIALSANGTEKYIKSLEPEGASEEGMSYWSYGLSNTFLAFEAMKRCLSTTYGLAENNGFKKTGWFPYSLSGPVGTATMGDDYIYAGRENKFMSYFWFSHYFNDANLAKTHYEASVTRNASRSVKMNGWTDLLFYKPQLVAQGSASGSPLHGHVKGIEYMYLQENAGAEALYVGMHGGDNDASHGHLDAGSFYLQALGETWAQGNLGVENPYPADFFKSTAPAYTASPTNTAGSRGRFYYYRVRTEGKNCLVFNPDARPEQNPLGKATLAASAHDNAGGYYVLNLTDVYERDVSGYQRGIKLNRSHQSITIQDEFTPLASSTVYWLMHSPATDNLVISGDGRTAVMTKNGKTFYAQIKAPANASFTKVDRSETQINYLPETAPIFSAIMNGQNSVNRWYGKLQIKLTGLPAATKTTIRVDFVKSPGSVMPGLADLNTWTTSN